MTTSFIDGRRRSTRIEPPTMSKQLVSFITCDCERSAPFFSNLQTQALVSFKTYMPPPLPYFKVNICPLPLRHFASIFFTYLWSFRWPNYIVTLPRYFSFRLPHLNIPTGPLSDELDKNILRTSHFLFFSHWNGYSHFRSVLNWLRN
jgi:hypothetical protein